MTPLKNHWLMKWWQILIFVFFAALLPFKHRSKSIIINILSNKIYELIYPLLTQQIPSSKASYKKHFTNKIDVTPFEQNTVIL